MPRVSFDKLARRPRAITVLGGLMIAVGAIGVVSNGYNYFTGNPAYTPALWLTFVVLKFMGLVAGLLLLKMRRAGAWLSAVSFAGGLVVGIVAAGPYRPMLWLGAALVGTILVAAFWLVIRAHWNRLRPMGGLEHA